MVTANFQLSRSLIAERKWAKNIGNIQNLKTLLDKGNSLAVEKIASCLNKDTFWVFATKYCHFHNPKDFPIFDQYTEKALGYTYTDRTKPVSKWYNSYRLSVQGAINSTEENYSFFQMDCFLWLKGQKMMIQKNDNKKNTLSREIQFSMKEHQELWQQL